MSLPPRHKTAAAFAFVCAWLFGLSTADAQSVSFSCRANTETVLCDGDLRPAWDAHFTKKLKSGFRNTFQYRLYVRRVEDDEPVALEAWRWLELYELWDEVYFLSSDTGPRTEHSTFAATLKMLGTFKDKRAAGKLPKGEYYADLIIEMNPLGREEESEIRRWIARSRGGHRTFSGGDRSFFGTFVSLFINIRPGAAERVLRFQTPTFKVSGG